MVLEFPGLVAAILLIICVFVRHVWRNEAAEEEEAIRMFSFTSSSSQGNEVAPLQTGASFGSVMKRLCFVCLTPSTSRCSRCKSARYCDVKCQIIHWRLGHKYECQPPINSQSSNESKPVVPVALNAPSEISADNHNTDSFPQFPISNIPSSKDPASQVLGSPAPNENDNLDTVEIDSKKESSPISGSTTLLCQSVSQAKKLNKRKKKKKISHAINKRNPRVNVSYKRNKIACEAIEVEVFPGSETEPWNSSSSFASRKFSLELNNEVAFSDEEETLEESRPSYAAGKYKEIFPYVLFVKLYSCEGLAVYPFGLVNIGNSCYANAVLQCLAFSRPITSYLIQGLHSTTCSREDWCFLCEFQLLMLKGRESNSPLRPTRILSEIRKIGGHLSPGSEEDAHEFLRFAIDKMQSICLEGTVITYQHAEESTLIGLTFGGYLRSKIKCTKCLGTSERYDRIMDLTVEIDGDIQTLDEALAQFTAYETLDGDNKYNCGRCKSHEKAVKRLTVHEAPNILTIVLKRFKAGNLEKLNKFIYFPEHLNLAPYMSKSGDKCPMYHLYAVVVHLTTTNAAYSGHYICYVKNFSGEWFRVDDSKVTATKLEAVLFEQAYILLYSRDTPRAPFSIGMGEPSVEESKGNLEAVPSSDDGLIEVPIMEASIVGQSVESLRQLHFQMVPNLLGSAPLQHHPVQGNHTSDSSSPFCFSDATTTTTTTSNADRAKDYLANDMSVYTFGSGLNNNSPPPPEF